MDSQTHSQDALNGTFAALSMENAAPKGIMSLPNEMVHDVSSYLSQKDRFHLIQTCRGLRRCLLPVLYKKDAEDSEDHHALWWACIHGRFSTLHRILKYTDTPSIPSELLNRHFKEYSHKTSTGFQRALTSQREGCDEGHTPLAVAVINGHYKFAEGLLARDASPHIPNNSVPWIATDTNRDAQPQKATSGWYPIHMAMLVQDLKKRRRLLQLLLSKGASLEQAPQHLPTRVSNNLGLEAPIFHTVGISFPNSARFRLPGANQFQFRNAFRMKLQKQLHGLKMVLELGADPNARDLAGCTPLMRLLVSLTSYRPTFAFDAWMATPSENDEQRQMVHQNIMERIRVLINSGADVHTQANVNAELHASNSEIRTLLHLACCLPPGHEDLVVYLVEQGIDVNSRGSLSRTPLFEYCNDRTDDASVFAWLIRQGADVTHCDMNGCTPLHALSHQESPNWATKVKYARLLIQNGADPQAKDNGGRTPLDYATAARHSELEDFLTDVVERRDAERQRAHNQDSKRLQASTQIPSQTPLQTSQASLQTPPQPLPYSESGIATGNENTSMEQSTSNRHGKSYRGFNRGYRGGQGKYTGERNTPATQQVRGTTSAYSFQAPRVEQNTDTAGPNEQNLGHQRGPSGGRGRGRGRGGGRGRGRGHGSAWCRGRGDSRGGRGDSRGGRGDSRGGREEQGPQQGDSTSA